MENLSSKKEKAVIALIEHNTIKSAAQSLGLGEATIFRWLQEETFQRALSGARKRLVQQAIIQLQKVTKEAVTTLREVMKDGKSPASSRVTAARIVLEMSVKGMEMEDLLIRVETLERKINESKRV